ncbi:MAG TPA: protein kinase [Candidatus Paceibacterota bacterium]|nr:protein kinase [Candidatus Paceibacterota bacterium]
MRACDRCGTKLGNYGPEGLCPKCLLLDGVGDEGLRRFGDYELFEEIARGGMGVIWKARQITLNRTVALKMMLSGIFALPESKRRFRAEAEAAASLQHPNIVAIHDIGEFEGQPFFSMDYIEGQDLSRLVGSNPLPAPKAVSYLKAVAQAVHYAHQHGILHRDLKPSNILIDAFDQPRVTDFGLAKRLIPQSEIGDPQSAKDLTLSGQVLGSPNYLPPEQAEARHDQVGPASDVYSLGAVLYWMLTARAPFQAATVADTLHQVSTTDPVSPRLLNPSVPKDLETICLKCLEKEIPRRYATARELADDLGRFQRHEPIYARPLSPLGKSVRWRRRNPRLAAALTALFLVFFAGFAGVTWQWRRARDEARRAEAAVTRLEIGQAELLFGNQRAADALAYLARVLRREPDNRVAAERILSALSYGNFCVPVLGLHHDALVTAARFSADSRWLVTASKDRTARVWDSVTGELRFAPLRLADEVLDARFSPDGKWLVTAAMDGAARIWDAATGQAIGPPLQHAGPVRWAEFSPDSTRVATASEDSTARVWEAVTGQPVTPPLRHQRLVYSARFSPDGRWVVTASADNSAAVWDTQTGQLSGDFLKSNNRVFFAEFSSDGRHVFTGGDNGFAQVWRMDTKQEVARVSHSGLGIFAGGFNPNGCRLVTGSDDRTAQLWDFSMGGSVDPPRIWDFPMGKPVGPPMKHDDRLTAVEFSPEGERVLTGSWDGTARIWDARTALPLTQPLRHEAPLVAAHFSPDGLRVVTVPATTTAWVWEIRLAQPHTLPFTHNNLIRSVGFSPDGRRLLTASFDRTARIWDTQTGQPWLETYFHRRFLAMGEFSPDGGKFLTACLDGTASVYDVTTGWLLFEPLAHHPQLEARERERIEIARFSPDGQRVLTASWDGTARLWNAHNGNPLTEPLRHEVPTSGAESFRNEARLNAAEFSPDGTWALTASNDQTARLWAADSGRLLQTFKHEGAVNSAHFSPDGQRVITASTDKTARLWPLRTGELRFSLHHEDAVTEARFSPNGQRVATCSRNTARVWSALTGQPLTDPVKHDGQVNCLRWSPDGEHIVSGCDDSQVRLWDAHTGQWTAQPWRQSSGITCVEFSPDGHWIASGTRNGSAHLIEVIAAPGRSPAWVPELAEAMAGQRFNAQNESEPVPVETFLRLRQQLEQNTPAGVLGLWARWFLAPTASRALSPSATMTVPQMLQRIVQRACDGSYDNRDKLADARTAAMLAPANGAALAVLAERLWAQESEDHSRHTNEATWLMRRAVELAPDAAEVWLARSGLSSLQGASIDQILACLEAAIERQPANYSFWENKAAFLHRHGTNRPNQIEEIIQVLKRTLEVMPSVTPFDKKRQAQMFRNRAVMLLNCVRLTEAAADFHQALELEPFNGTDWLYATVLLAQTGDYAGFETLRQRMLDQFKETTSWNVARQIVRAGLLRPASGDALAAADRLAALIPTQHSDPGMQRSCHLTLGLVAFRAGRFTQASDWIQKVIDQMPPKPFVPQGVITYALLALIQQQLGQSDEARAALAKADNFFRSKMDPIENLSQSLDGAIAQIMIHEARKALGESTASSPFDER